MTSQATKESGTILAENIRAIREEMGWTQKELAAAIGQLDALAVSRWERGVSVPRQDNLQALASATDRTLGWFWTDHSGQRPGGTAA